MFSSLLSGLLLYGIPPVVGIVAGAIFKSYYASKIQQKLRQYQNEIVSSHAKILELQARNFLLEKQVKLVEGTFAKDRIFMN